MATTIRINPTTIPFAKKNKQTQSCWENMLCTLRLERASGICKTNRSFKLKLDFLHLTNIEIGPLVEPFAP